MEAQKGEAQGQMWQSPSRHHLLPELSIVSTYYVPVSTYYVLDADIKQ